MTASTRSAVASASGRAGARGPAPSSSGSSPLPRWPASRPQRERRPLGDRVARLRGPSRQRRLSASRFAEAPVEGLLAAHPPPREHQLHRPRLPITRVRRWVAPPDGIRPSVTSGTPKRASLRPPRRSQASASSQPKASAQPMTRGDDRSADRAQAGPEVGHQDVDRQLRSRPEKARVGPVAKKLAGAGEHDAAGREVCVEPLEPCTTSRRPAPRRSRSATPGC